MTRRREVKPASPEKQVREIVAELVAEPTPKITRKEKRKLEDHVGELVAGMFPQGRIASGSRRIPPT